MKSNEEMIYGIYDEFNKDVGQALRNAHASFRKNEALVSDPESGIDVITLVYILSMQICGGIFIKLGNSELAKETLQNIMATSWKETCSKKDAIEELKRSILNGEI